MDTGLRRYDEFFIGVGKAGMTRFLWGGGQVTTTPSVSRTSLRQRRGFCGVLYGEIKTFVITAPAGEGEFFWWIVDLALSEKKV